MDSMPPLSSLRLLIPPLRLMSAFMWHVAEEQKLEHYEKLENFVSLVTKMVPDLLSHRQKATLLMGLRAKMLLEMCRGDLPVDSQTVKTHLHQIQSSLPKPRHSEMDILQSNLLSLILKLLEDPVKKEKFFQRVYPVKYGPDFDKALQVLVCFFISRLEQLLPKPNFKQVASWMNSPSLWDECEQYLSQTEDLQLLLQDNCHRSLEKNGLPSVVEDRIIDSLSLSPTATAHRSQNDMQSEPCLDAQSSSSQTTHQANQKIQGLLQNCQEVDTTSGVGKDKQRQCDIEDDDEYDVGTELDLSEYGGREKEITEDTNVSDFAHKFETHRGTPPTASESFDMEDITVEKPTLPDTSGQNHGETLSGGVPMDTTLPSEFCSTFPVNRSDQTVQETPAGTRHGNRMNRNANLTVPSQTSAQQITPLVLSDTSNDQDDRNEEELSQGVADSQVVFDLTSKGSSSSTPTKSLVSQWAKKKKKKKKEKKKTHISTPFQCSHCGREFETLSGLSSHKRAHRDCADSSPPSCSEETPKETEVTMARIRQSECAFCGMNISTEEMNNHLLTHKGIRPYRCNHCDKSYVNRSSLKAHVSNHTGEKPHLCEECGKSFFSPGYLRAHMKNHSADKHHCCPYCGKLFSFLGSLNVHICIHTGERPYLCSTCGKSFQLATCLQVHERCHTGEKPYKCGVCDRGFTTSSHRLVHARMHTGERPFSCSVCGRRFSRKYDHKKHMQTHSGDRPYKCPECRKSYTRMYHLKTHRKTHRK
ncbi:zinc finger protein 454-like isoform X2 [Clupea harengus]|uniref:Zinc finger protein 454-like isoform X2 n=1 Tax=Clupea harengus TaxID=7950 RepID=A0A6P8GHD9_CLUHA|nr:zinc finger protein 454-like isoform X2 [Clupea harengus]